MIESRIRDRRIVMAFASQRSLRPLAVVSGMVAFWFLMAAPVPAQFTTASLSGIVTDASGASIPGATVTVMNLDTGFRQTVASGATGEYLFPRLPIGAYKLTVEKSGFSTYVQS